MTTHIHAPHVQGSQGTAAPNAALLIDFDNVTMGMRSDLSKDLRKLLQSDVIRGKVTVQRAYADWRRYPQYIVPLSENSIDLIFAPAYGSSKKNATDIRMAIDAIELVFTRPEIGTFILLTGDSDFSSCVLKLKEYGKYVIGVGIQESSSDILVQNCDEYYSYTSLAGLQKTTETDVKSMDPWELVERALKKMVDKGDVMRSDRLKQVMLEIDSTFDEGGYGFSKFSRFVTEAASRNILNLKKMPNGQYEVTPAGGSGGSGGGGESRRKDDGRGRGRRGGGRDSDRGRSDSSRSDRGSPSKEEPRKVAAQEDDSGDGAEGFELLVKALKRLKDDGRSPVRDSDVKRKMLELQEDFDESTLGFSKFSHFLREAGDRELVKLERQDGGSYDVTLTAEGTASSGTSETSGGATSPKKGGRAQKEEPESQEGGDDRAPDDASEEVADVRDTVQEEVRPEDVIDDTAPGRRLGPRGGTTRRRGGDDPPPILEGQGRPARSGSKGKKAPKASEDVPSKDGGSVDVAALDLPTEPDRIVRYLTAYKGVGQKTAEQVVESFGDRVFHVLQDEPERMKEVLPAGRADQIVTGWREDLKRRQSGDGAPRGGRRRGRRSGRSRGGKRGDR
ncbi:MAG: NYN domain-containing protein [Gemmatimonadota bacterium]